MESQFNAGHKDHANLRADVKVKLEDGVVATLGQIMNKWNQLKRRYREVKDHNKDWECMLGSIHGLTDLLIY